VWKNKEQLLRVTTDMLYDMLVQAGYLPMKNKLGSRKDDGFYRFHKAMGHNIEECKEFHHKAIQLMTCGLLQIEKRGRE